MSAIASSDLKASGFEAILVMAPALDLQAAVSHVETVEDAVLAGGEVRLERKLVDVGHIVADAPEVERVLSLERLVIGVEAPLEAVDVDERFPRAGDRGQHLVVDDELVGLPWNDRIDDLAGGRLHVPSNRVELVAEV